MIACLFYALLYYIIPGVSLTFSFRFYILFIDSLTMPSNFLNKVSETPVTISFISLSLLLVRLIIFLIGVNLMSIILLGTWFNNTCIPKPTGFRWVPGQAG
jgi:hypothetical protein